MTILPRWLIDDTADLTNARMFAVHTRAPRLIGELVPEDESAIDGIQFGGLPYGQILTRIVWIDQPDLDVEIRLVNVEELCGSLAAAIEQHAAARGWT